MKAAYLLDPLSQYRVFGIFPFKIIIDWSLILFLSIALFNINLQLQRYAREQQFTFFTIFLDDEIEVDATLDYYRFKDLYKTSDIIEQIQKGIDYYFSLDYCDPAKCDKFLF